VCTLAAVLRLQGRPESQMLDGAVDAALTTLDAFRPKPNRLGRARSYGERSAGLLDSGQIAFLRLVEALAAR
jgi:dihydroxyacetone kinase-like protein